GGGGTEFEPVFHWMQQQGRFDGFLYLTDGYGPAPSTRPSCRLLWVVARKDHSGFAGDLPFGPTVHLEVD
ncbi:MAG: hypothetical protein EBS01_16040, partial [Verrucomicrobia bacterium]|nr:hypothetical protein [Verrucomicrobiota bacterium]